ncbi:MAG: cell wall-binding repeat-containing protein [Chloroflexota bacterium]
MQNLTSPTRRAGVSLLVAIHIAVLALVAAPFAPVETGGPIPVTAGDVRISVDGEEIVALPFAASHVALHWPGVPDALVTVAFSQDAQSFGAATEVDHDEVGDRAGSTETYGNVLVADGARFVRVTSDRALADVTVVTLDSQVDEPAVVSTGSIAKSSTGQPAVISRAAWGANESYRYDSQGLELWPRVFQNVQKVVIHHTAGPNYDPNPAATVRSIMHYDAITKEWSDMGYNYLIDNAGQIYEGRYSREYAPGETPTGEDLTGRLVTGAHVLAYNSGVLGIVMMGTYSNSDITPAARASLEKLVAWATERYGIDPLGASTYVHPTTGAQRTFPNIVGHRDLTPTACPGGVFYATLPALRSAVAARIATNTGPGVDATAPAVASMAPITVSPTMGTSVSFGVVFSEPVTGLAAEAIAITGTSTGWSVASITGSASIYRVNLTADAPTAGTVELTLAAGGVADLAGLGGPAAPTVSSAVTWVPGLIGTVTRISGADRYHTAAAISAASFAPGVPVAYVATGTNFPDALAGAVVAAIGTGPMLLVPSGSIPPVVAAELTRLAPGRIVVLGGPSVVSDGVAAALAGYTGGGVTRISGADRYQTAAAVSAATFAPGVPVAYIATGLKFPDALAGAVVAAITPGPMLLVPGASIPPAVAAELTRLAPGRIVLLGGPSVISSEVEGALAGYTGGGVTRLAGANRYDTSAAISAASFAQGIPVVYVATGMKFPDALAGAVVAAMGPGPMLLIPGGSIPPAVAAELARLAPGRIVILGGLSVVSGSVEAALAGYLAH